MRLTLLALAPTKLPSAEQKLASTTDPNAPYAPKGGTPARLGYYDITSHQPSGCGANGLP